ncbi:hypothetical protein ABIB06_006596 [Bradyrhizobium sp. LB8.2]|uniref:hypothetical protein n=1 Tax=Bradyrhizobium sp. LB8.2 TaxID=3156330 RepID=UPI0033992C98
MSQFIYTTPGRQRPAAVIHTTVSFKLEGAKGAVFWTDSKQHISELTPADWMPLAGHEGTISGATFLRVCVDELTADLAMLTTLPSTDHIAGLASQFASTCICIAHRQLEADGLI